MASEIIAVSCGTQQSQVHSVCVVCVCVCGVCVRVCGVWCAVCVCACVRVCVVCVCVLSLLIGEQHEK